MLTLGEREKESSELARAINREGRKNPASPYAEKFVALLRGQIVAVTDTPEAAITQLRLREPDRMKGVVFEASANYETVDYIWKVG